MGWSRRGGGGGSLFGWRCWGRWQGVILILGSGMDGWMESFGRYLQQPRDGYACRVSSSRDIYIYILSYSLFFESVVVIGILMSESEEYGWINWTGQNYIYVYGRLCLFRY